MKISVVMAARYRSDHGPRCLKSVLWQTRPPHEIIMVDCGENEWAADIGPTVRALNGSEVEFKRHRYAPASVYEYAYTHGVNAAWPRCTGDYIFITTTDALAPVRCIEASIAMQVGTSRVCHLCYGLNRATTNRLDDPAFRWAGTDMRLFHSLPGFEDWWKEGPRWPHPNNSVIQQAYWNHTLFTSNTREGWLDSPEWPDLPFPTPEFIARDTWFLAATDERSMAYLEESDSLIRKSGVGKRPVTKCPIPVYHQWHLEVKDENRLHGWVGRET